MLILVQPVASLVGQECGFILETDGQWNHNLDDRKAAEGRK